MLTKEKEIDLVKRGDMVFAENERISLRQMQCIIMLNMLSFGFFVFPTVFQGFSGLEIIASAGVGGFLAMLIAKGVIYVCSDKSKGLGDVLHKYLGQRLGLFFSIIFLFYFILRGSSIVFMYSSAIKGEGLLKTPTIAVIAVALAILLYITLKGIETIGRMAEILIIFIFVGILFVFVFAANSGGFSNLSSVRTMDVKDIAVRGLKGFYFFQGMEIFLVLNMYREDKTVAEEGALTGVFGIVWIIMTFSAFLIFTKLKVIDGNLYTWPFIKVADSIEIPFAFIERQDFIIIFLSTVFMVFGAALNVFSSAVILSEITKRFNAMRLFSHVTLVGLIIVLIVKAKLGFGALGRIETVLGIVCFAVVPFILATIKKLKGV